jgi:hypothetical protein
MKKILILFAISIFIASCGKNDDNNAIPGDELGQQPSGNQSIDGISEVDNVSLWNKEDEIVFIDYYSLIDTIIAERNIVRDVKYYCDENENVTVKWSINGMPSANTAEGKVWKDDIQKWLVTSTVTLNVEGIDKNLRIEAIVQFPGKSVRRAKTIPKITVIKDVSDAFGFTFGTKRTDMNDVIVHDFSPQFASANNVSSKQPFLFLEFSNGELIRLYAVADISGYYYLINAAQRCKAPEELIISAGPNPNFHFIIENPQEWTIGKLKIKAYNLDAFFDPFYLGACLTIEKI